MSIKFLVVGGDMRNYYLYNLLKKDFFAELIGFEKYDEKFNIDLEKVKSADVIIAPTPLHKDKIDLPFSDYVLTIDELLDLIDKEQIVMGGAICEEFLEKANKKNIDVFDILKREEVAILNAIPTSEGAILKAMTLMDTTIHDSNVLVVGFGRIGKNLSKSLQGLGATVYVATDIHSEIATATSYGYKAINLYNMEEHFKNIDLIINTIPHIYFNQHRLNLVKKECLILDLASKPFGVDFDEAKKLGLKAVQLPGLPGKVAPKTAAGYLKLGILNILKEKGGIINGY